MDIHGSRFFPAVNCVLCVFVRRCSISEGERYRYISDSFILPLFPAFSIYFCVLMLLLMLSICFIRLYSVFVSYASGKMEKREKRGTEYIVLRRYLFVDFGRIQKGYK